LAPSLRQFEHVDEIYKDRLIPADCPRLGDFAEIRRICCRNDLGVLVRVVNNPHWCVTFCGDCQVKIKEWIVQVEPVTDFAGWLARQPPPWFYPIAWLKRWEAQQVSNRAASGR
jgi:hypothetical protein